MKKIVIAVITILTMLFSMLPASSVLAKKDGWEVYLFTRNRTGGNVTISLIGKNGNKLFFNYGEGSFREMVAQGVYSYHIVTPCQNLLGVMNLNVAKDLYLACDQGVDNESPAELSVHWAAPRASAQYCYAMWDYPDASDGTNPEDWKNYGPHCQDNPAQVGNMILHQVEDSTTWYTLRFYNSPDEACAPARAYGPAFYFYDCPTN